ncbi:MAG: flagellar biosynthesis protein FliQ [Firmicutes bacterium]|jgi:flagellar biosynthetic protein FliQ|nr:flagellar biosynthesis protein FliQ [Bacillota bacterium]
MSEATVTAISARALYTALMLGLPVLGVAVLVGVVVSVIQAATQIQEMTLTFVPKMLAIAAVLLIAGPWMIATMVGFAREMFNMLPALAK